MITLAGKLLGNVGVQTDNDAQRTLKENLTMILGNLEDFFKDNRDATVPVAAVQPLIDSIESSLAGAIDATKERIKLTGDTYEAGRGLPADKRAVVEKLYTNWGNDLRKKNVQSPVNGEAPVPKLIPQGATNKTVKQIREERLKNGQTKTGQ